MNKRGIALILSFIVIIIVCILGASIVTRSISESRIAQRYAESTEAFWLAEAGINHALDELRNNYYLSSIAATPLGPQGGYQVTITQNGNQRIVNSSGYIPFSGTALVTRTIQAVMSKSIPPNFYDNAIYSAGDVILNGSTYAVTGNIIYAENINDTNNVTGDVTQDPSISPLARLDFQQLETLSTEQENLYEQQGHDLVNVSSGLTSFPNTFWFSRADDSIDNDGDGTTDEEDEWVPNIIYIRGDLQVNGNIGTIGGFFIVAGDVINTPDVSQDAIINGNGQIDGVIYTRGEFRVNGGGGNLNVNGGVWAGEQARLNGNAMVTYNGDYMAAIQALNIDASVQIISWRDTQNPYQLTP